MGPHVDNPKCPAQARFERFGNKSAVSSELIFNSSGRHVQICLFCRSPKTLHRCSASSTPLVNQLPRIAFKTHDRNANKLDAETIVHSIDDKAIEVSSTDEKVEAGCIFIAKTFFDCLLP